MANFKIVVSEPDTRKSTQREVDQEKAAGLIGKKIGDDVNGDILDMPGYVLKITGGSDKDGFPMHPSLNGSGRRKILLTNPPGYHPDKKGKRKRKMVRGNTISPDIVQINLKVVKKPTGAEKKEEKVEKKIEQKAEGKKEETPQEPLQQKTPDQTKEPATQQGAQPT